MIFFDFEYNEHRPLLCMAEKVGLNSSESCAFDLRNSEEITDLSNWIEANKDEIFVSYALSAEIESLLRLGIDVSRMLCIDLMAECRMITMSNDSYFTADSSMLGQRRALLKQNVQEDRAHKEEMRQLIITKNSWTADEWDSIALYCWSDIEPLKELMRKVLAIHAQEAHPITLEVMLNRGEYVRMCAEMDFASPGFPVYGGDVEKIYGNKNAVKDSIINGLPYYWKACFQKKKEGGWTLKRKAVEELATARGWWAEWKKTETGMPVLEADYLKELSLRIEQVHSLYTALRALTTLNSADLRTQIVNGYIRTKTFSFAAKTGRNGLKPKHGFLLNLPSWMRRIVHPHPGMVLIGVDWSQQEIAIAAAMSGDAELIAAYQSGDVYLALGKMAGHIPADGTKVTHKRERDLFKALQLALGYGKGVNSLGLDFFAIMKEDGVSLLEAKIKAKEIFQWHKMHFSTYWAWIESRVKEARLNGWIETGDGWVEWVSKRTLSTQLLNFPSQATGAEMMRNATKAFYKEWSAGNLCPVLCSQHDAFYFNSTIDDAEKNVELIEQVMRESSKALIGIEVRCGTKIFDVEHSYLPDSWESRHEVLWNAALNA